MSKLMDPTLGPRLTLGSDMVGVEIDAVVLSRDELVLSMLCAVDSLVMLDMLLEALDDIPEVEVTLFELAPLSKSTDPMLRLRPVEVKVTDNGLAIVIVPVEDEDELDALALVVAISELPVKATVVDNAGVVVVPPSRLTDPTSNERLDVGRATFTLALVA